ncbi:hypothetical protein QQF64_001434 [Cirrhinus molitorella]|uniref:Uncharacterized protein n=1 Tax=Cirrhinus molitorella TaxID=172907 RepID=A0ABR3P0N2_9TELE
MQSQSNPLRNSWTKQAAPQRQHFTLGICLTERMNLIERLLSETVRASTESFYLIRTPGFLILNSID